MKKCKFCWDIKDISGFSKKSGSIDWLNHKCKDCHNKYVKDIWYPKNSEKHIKAVKQWREENQFKVLKNRYKELADSDIECFINSEKICQICWSLSNIALDHCHKKNIFRGVLCNRCNKWIWIFNDDIILLNNAIEYLSK